MEYEKQNFTSGSTLHASELNHIEDGIASLVSELNEIKSKLEDISSSDREKMKRLQEGFNNVMNYDINVAMGREDK